MKQLFTFLFLAFSLQVGYGQWTYNTSFSTDSGNPGAINTEGDAPGQASWVDIIDGPQAANVWSPATPLPFAFDFFGTPVTQFKASQNGLVTFDVASGLLPNANATLPDASLPNNTIAVLWDEFTATPSTGSGDDIRIKTFGTAPNRQFWIKWYSFEIGNPTLSFAYFACVLEESTNKIYFVDQYSTASPASSATLGVQLNATTAVEFSNNFAIAGNGSAAPDNDYLEYTPVFLTPDDAGIAGFATPVNPLSAGLQNVDVTLNNFGTNSLNSATINWEIDGTAQTAVNYATPLAAGTSTVVNLGTYNFPVGTTTLKAWTTSPNGVADNNNANDTTFISLCTGLSGTLTLGPAGDYTSFAAAATALADCGVGGPVVFDIAPGTYTENLILGPITGASATNTITFDGGAAASVTLTHDGVAGSAVVGLIGARYITVKNMTLINTATVDAWGVKLRNEANYNTIDSCVIMMEGVATNLTDVIGVSASNSDTDDFTEGNNANYNTISNNTIMGAEMGIHFEAQSANRNAGNKIWNNTLLGAEDYGIYMDDQDSLEIVGNTISGLRSTFADGIYIFDIVDFKVNGNNVKAPDYGFYLWDGNFDAPATLGQSEVINNMIISDTDYGMYFDDFESVNVFHNTVLGEPGIRINDVVGVDIRNNIFASTGDFAFESDDDATLTLDYNIYYAVAGNTNFVDFGPTVHADLAFWQAASPALNNASQEGDPVFVASDDLHVAGAIAFDTGDNSVGVPTDIDGDVRPLAPTATVDVGADEYTPLVNDAGIVAFDSPVSPFGAGMQPVSVVLRNFSIATLSTATIGWSVDGAVQTTVPFAGTVAPTSNESGVALGMFNFPAGFSTLRAWTSTPNGFPDQQASNDTIEIDVCTSLAGTYTVGGVGADFATITDAVNAAISCGISAPTVFNVAAGTYLENVVITEVPGASATNTLTIDGGDAATTTISYDGMGGLPVIDLMGADYIVLRNLGISNTAITDGWGIKLRDTADYNTIDSCLIVLDMTTTNFADVIGISASNSITDDFTEGNNANYTTITNNTIMGGEMSIHFEAQSTNRNAGNRFWNNQLLNAEDYGIYIDDQDSVEIVGNTITGVRNSGGDGIYSFDLVDFIISGNNINVPDYGLYVFDGNFDAAPTLGRSQIVNNMIISFADYAMYLDDIEELDIFHNTTSGNPGIRINDFIGVDIRNNIFTSVSDFAFESDDDAPLDALDFNVYYTPASNSNFVDFGPNLYTDLAAWQAADPALNINSAEGDPVFLAADDLHAQGQIANDAGDNSVGITVDIDGDLRPQAPATTVDIGADEYTPLTDNVAVTAISSPLNGTCGDSITDITLNITNLGSTIITSLPVVVYVSGDLTDTLNSTYTGPLAFGESGTFVAGSFNSYAGGIFSFTAILQLPGDQDTSNDTVAVSGIEIVPFAPIGFEAIACGVDTAVLEAYATTLAGYTWYDSATGGNVVGTGSSFTVPSIASQDTYYLEYQNNSDTLETIFGGTNGCAGGNMFDITAINSVPIRGFMIDPNSSGNTNVTIHYIPNSTYVGNEINAAAWTTQGSFSVPTTLNVPAMVTLDNPLVIPAGATYAIYVEYDANYTSLTTTYSNADMTISTGAGLCSSFGGANPDRTFNGSVIYGYTGCSNDRVPVSATANPLPVSSFTTTEAGLEVTFDAAGSVADSLTYDFGDGTSSTDSATTHTYPADGTYTVTLISEVVGCGTDTTELTFSVCADMTAGFSAVATDLDVVFTDTTSGAPTSWAWDFGDGSVDSTASPSHTFASDDIYMVQLITTNICGSDTVVQMVAACAAMEGGFDVMPTDTLAGEFAFSDTTSGTPVSWSWDFGDSGTSTDQNPVHTYATSDLFTVTLIVENACGVIDTVTREVSFTSSIDNGLSNATLEIYPNPSKGQIQLDITTERIDEMQIEIFDARGKLVRTHVLNNLIGFHKERLDLSDLADGIYVLKILADGQVGAGRVLIQK